jgi:hypothetical protein
LAVTEFFLQNSATQQQNDIFCTQMLLELEVIFIQSVFSEEEQTEKTKVFYISSHLRSRMMSSDERNKKKFL